MNKIGPCCNHEYIATRCVCGRHYCLNCNGLGCPSCGSRERDWTYPQPPVAPAVTESTLTAIRAIAAHVTDSRLAMAAIRVLLEEK